MHIQAAPRLWEACMRVSDRVIAACRMCTLNKPKFRSRNANKVSCDHPAFGIDAHEAGIYHPVLFIRV